MAASTAAQIRLSPFASIAGLRLFPAGTHQQRSHYHDHLSFPCSSLGHIPFPCSSLGPFPTLSIPHSSNPGLSHTLTSPDHPVVSSGGGSPSNPPFGPGDSGHGGGNDGPWGPEDGARGDDENPPTGRGPLDLFLQGWRSRVAADPQFPFKVLMEEIVGVSACVLGDMASRPNFGLNELDFVFCTLVVGSIVNFVLMYLLAPTVTASAAASVSSLPSYMFEPGPYSLFSRLGTFVYKGVTFAAVGFAAGLAGTAISNGLIALRKKMDPQFETPNKPPPTVLNALAWALHMGLSSNVRYQTLNGVEFVIEKALPPAGFKASVVALRCLNNVLGGMSFVMLARLTGSQKSSEAVKEEKELMERLVDGNVAVPDAGRDKEVGSES